LESHLSLSSNNNSYIGSLAYDFNRSIKSPGRFVLPNNRESFSQNAFVNSIAVEKKENRSNFGYYSGITAAVLQVIGGGSILWGSLISKRETKEIKIQVENEVKAKEKEIGKANFNWKKRVELEKFEKTRTEHLIKKSGKDSYINVIGSFFKKREGSLKTFGEKLAKYADSRHLKGLKANRIGWKIMGASWLIGIPSCIGASVNVKQPSMLFGSLDWLIASPLMMLSRFENSKRLIGFQTIGYSLMYAGIANKVKNDHELKDGEKPRNYDFSQINKGNFIKKSFELLKFTAKDLSALPKAGATAISQSHDYLTGKRKEKPDFWTTNPTQDNSRLASLLLLPGSLMLLTFAKKYKPIERVAGYLIGFGLLSEALYMYTLGKAQKGANKPLIMAGVPLRAIGDFGPTVPAMLGMRTIGGASFEYYFATLNKENKKDKQVKA